MTGTNFSLILLPTLACNADCEYCFENKTDQHLTLDQLAVLMEKVIDFLEQESIARLSIYWQGGEVMTLPPAWFEQADVIIRKNAVSRKKEVVNYLQSNMIGYSGKWNRVIAEMFANSVGSSMDFPNLHRRLTGGGPEEYEALWIRKVREARQAGIQVSVIAIPNEKTLEMGAERFYSRFVDELGFTEFQVNTPFPGGQPNQVKEGYPLDSDHLAGFLLDLAKIWLDRGFAKGVHAGPFSSLMEYFVLGHKDLLCIWQDNCANGFACIDPLGHVSQCDCWAASYPGFRFGNIFQGPGLSSMLRNSDTRRMFQERPGVLIQREDCIQCDYLGICHGGCPVRSYSVHGDIRSKDPYCRLYRTLFEGIEELAISHARHNTAAAFRGANGALCQETPSH
ncbi:MAG: radical SAM protein [Geobacteraceae bacterium]|nr:radical SAM protein [Geobacteraceae bacterium]